MDARIILLLAGVLFPAILGMYVEDGFNGNVKFKLRPKTLYITKSNYNDSDEQTSYLLINDKPHRVLRSTSTCKIPHQLENSNVSCVSYPSNVKCVQTCMFGYTFSEGRHRVMVCDRSKNMWTPTPEFESCDPFIDCGVTLSSGGKIKCKTHFMDRGTTCEISCHRYEDKAAVPPQIYGCNIDGSWTPELPFCARAGSGLALVPPPRR